MCGNFYNLHPFDKVLLTHIILCIILDEEYFLEAKSPFKKSILIMFTIEPFLEMLSHLKSGLAPSEQLILAPTDHALLRGVPIVSFKLWRF